MTKKTTKLTDRQKILLRNLPDTSYKLPGALEGRCYLKLERLGYATHIMQVVRHDELTNKTLHRPAYIRTPAGKALTENVAQTR